MPSTSILLHNHHFKANSLYYVLTLLQLIKSEAGNRLRQQESQSNSVALASVN